MRRVKNRDEKEKEREREREREKKRLFDHKKQSTLRAVPLYA